MSNDWAYILKLMREGESEQIKFFGRQISDQSLGSTISAMANTSGGLIVIGIDVINYHLVGSPVESAWIHKAVLTQLEPVLNIRIDRIKRDEKDIIIIHVPLGADPAYRFQGQSFVREKNITREATPQDDAELKPRAFAKLAAQSHEFWLVHPPEELDKDRPEETDDELDDGPVGSRTPLLVELVPNASPVEASGDDKDMNTDDSEYEDSESETDGESNFDSTVTNSEPKYSQRPVMITLNSRQKQAMSHLKDNGSIKNMEYRSLYQVSHKTAHLELVDLVAHGYLLPQGKGRSTCYVISPTALTLGLPPEASLQAQMA